MKKAGSKKNEAKFELQSWSIDRAIEFKNGNVGFDMTVNGIKLYGLVYMEGKKKDGSEYSFISFPSRKDEQENYWNHFWMPISKEWQDEIVAKLEEMV